MGTKGTEIVGVNVDGLIEMLNKALADEWLSFHMYLTGAKVVKGPMRAAAIEELMENAEEERKHADMLTDRIIELGGTPLLSPSAWIQNGKCGYKTPEVPWISNILQQNLDGERCAIEVYHDIINFIGDRDTVTFKIIAEILDDENEHEEELENLMEDLNLIRERLQPQEA